MIAAIDLAGMPSARTLRQDRARPPGSARALLEPQAGTRAGALRVVRRPAAGAGRRRLLRRQRMGRARQAAVVLPDRRQGRRSSGPGRSSTSWSTGGTTTRAIRTRAACSGPRPPGARTATPCRTVPAPRSGCTCSRSPAGRRYLDLGQADDRLGRHAGCCSPDNGLYWDNIKLDGDDRQDPVELQPGRDARRQGAAVPRHRRRRCPRRREGHRRRRPGVLRGADGRRPHPLLQPAGQVQRDPLRQPAAAVLDRAGPRATWPR